MSDSPKSGSILNDLFSLAEEASDFIEQVRVPSTTVEPRKFVSEALDWSIVVHLRSLLTHLAPSEVTFTQEVDCFRVKIGSGVKMRIYEGGCVGDVVIAACRGEGLVIPSGKVETVVDGGTE